MTEYVVQVRKVDPVDESLRGALLTYAYGTPLRIGDKVVCPPTPYSGGAWIAQVVALGRGDYQGGLTQILCRVAPDRKRRGAS